MQAFYYIASAVFLAVIVMRSVFGALAASQERRRFRQLRRMSAEQCAVSWLSRCGEQLHAGGDL